MSYHDFLLLRTLIMSLVGCVFLLVATLGWTADKNSRKAGRAKSAASSKSDGSESPKSVRLIPLGSVTVVR